MQKRPNAVTFKGKAYALVGPELKVGDTAPDFACVNAGLEVVGIKHKVSTYTISLDLPFAQKRFCAAEGVANMQTLSDVHNHSFGQAYGVLIEGLPLPLLSRAVFVVDKDGKISYAEYVPEVTSHPNYDNAAAALKAAV